MRQNEGRKQAALTGEAALRMFKPTDRQTEGNPHTVDTFCRPSQNSEEKKEEREAWTRMFEAMLSVVVKKRTQSMCPAAGGHTTEFSGNVLGSRFVTRGASCSVLANWLSAGKKIPLYSFRLRLWQKYYHQGQFQATHAPSLDGVGQRCP